MSESLVNSQESMGYSPSPWVNKNKHIFDADMRLVCNTSDAFRDDQSTLDANAHLIAAAPEMLEALEMCCELLRGQLDSDDGALDDGAITDALADICKTIAKAKGGAA